jgi:glycosyltransferase 2 family protein
VGAMTGKSVSFIRKHARALLASIAITVAFLWVMRAGALPVLPPRGTFDRLSAWPAAWFGAAMLTSMVTKYARYYFLLAPIARIPMRRVMSISCISMALITLLPLRLGEMSRPAMLRERGRLSGWAITATVGAERIIDGVAFGVVLLAGLALAPPHEPVPDHIGGLPVPAALVPRAAIMATSVFGVALAVMTVFYWRRDLARALTERLIGVVSRRLGVVVAGVMERTSDGLRFLTDLRNTAPYLAVTVLSVVANIWAVKLLGTAVGLQSLTFAQSSVVLGVLAIGFALPNAPGFFGAVQLALYAGLALYVSPETVTQAGASFVFIYYITYLGVVLSLALGALLVEYTSPGAGHPGSATTTNGRPEVRRVIHAPVFGERQE